MQHSTLNTQRSTSNSIGPIIAIDYSRIRRNAEEIKKLVGVPVIAVVKANAYGHDIRKVAETIADIVDGFCTFGIAEARWARLRELTNGPILAIGPRGDATPQDFLDYKITPAIYTVEQAKTFQRAAPALCVDTGMQRFACPAGEVAAALAVGGISQAFTHATRMEQVTQLKNSVGNHKIPLHAAGSSLMLDPAARLDAVRPGLALYRGAARISAHLVEVRKTNGPAGYTGFHATHHAVILTGYSHGLRPGPCLLNGRGTKILEVGMQSAFIEVAPSDKPGDEVILLGEGLEPEEIAKAWKSSPQEVLVSLLRSRRVI
jgi:alanine racemase